MSSCHEVTRLLREWANGNQSTLETLTPLLYTELRRRDPNGYAGIAWSIVEKFDRPWFEQPIFGSFDICPALVRERNSTAKSIFSGIFFHSGGCDGAES